MAKKSNYELLTSLRDELNAILGDSPAADAVSEEPTKKTNKKSTAPAAEDDYSEMAYNDLKKLCKSRGLSAAGNREELIARLNDAPAADEDDDDEDEKPVKTRTKTMPMMTATKMKTMKRTFSPLWKPPLRTCPSKNSLSSAKRTVCLPRASVRL